jgi:hypothetical protein
MDRPLLTLALDSANDWEIEAKGWLRANVHFQNKEYSLIFYDPVRLMQDCSEELESGQIFFEPNLVILQSVNRANMEAAVLALAERGHFALMKTQSQAH